MGGFSAWSGSPYYIGGNRPYHIDRYIGDYLFITQDFNESIRHLNRDLPLCMSFIIPHKKIYSMSGNKRECVDCILGL